MKVILIARSRQIEKIIVELVKQSIDINLFKYLNEEDQNLVLDLVYSYIQMNDPSIGDIANEVYKAVTGVEAKA